MEENSGKRTTTGLNSTEIDGKIKKIREKIAKSDTEKKSNSKIILLISLSIFLVVIISFVVYRVFGGKNSVKNDEEVVATSKYGDVTIGDIKVYLNSLNSSFKQNFSFDKITDEEKDLVVKEIVNNRIIYQKAKDTGITASKEYKKRVIDFQMGLAKEIYLKKLTDESITESNIKSRYEKIKKNLEDKKEYKVKHIVVKTKEEIDQIVEKLKTESFEDLAKQYSIDVSKDKGGDLGYIIDGQTVAEFENVVKEIEINKLSEPFQTKFGWHILVKEDERPAVVPEYEESKDTVKDILIKEIIREDSDKNLKDSDLKISVKIK